MLHHTGSTAPTVNQANYLATSDALVSCHYVIGAEGSIYQIAGNNKCTRHAGTGSYDGIVDSMNLHSIGIEVCSDGYEFTYGQRVAVRALIESLLQELNLDHTRIIRHKDYAPGRKWDI